MLKHLLLTTCLLGSLLCSANGQTLTAIPSFEACSIYFDTEDPSGNIRTEFRAKGSKQWQQAFPLVKAHDKKQLRGSIVNLQENTDYEVRLIQTNGSVTNTYTTSFKTQTLDVPIKKVIDVSKIKDFRGLLTITEKGTADGWLKYTAPPGFVLKGTLGQKPVIFLFEADYVILENLTIEGGYRHGISIYKSKNIRVINCDISGFGRIGKQDINKDGKYYLENGRYVNLDGGVNIINSKNVLVERCYIHDPRTHANAWKYSHPAGAEAVTVVSDGGVVLRYNDFIGSDRHRWNDGVESIGNGKEKGGLYRDSDIYGNMFAFGQDDGIELDGGQMNIRVWENKFEGFLCGVSTAPCLLGPSYTFKNLIVNLGDEFGKSNSAIKNNHGRCGKGQVFVFNNTAYTGSNGFSHYGGRGEDARYNKTLKGMNRNNLFHTKRLISPEVFIKKIDFDYNLYWTGDPDKDLETKVDLESKGQGKNSVFKKPEFAAPPQSDFNLKSGSPGIDQGTVVTNFIEDFEGKSPDIGAFEYGKTSVLPYRPIPVFLDKQQLNFTIGDNATVVPQTVIAEVAGKVPYQQDFKVMQNRDFDWFKVEPAHGTLVTGKDIKFSVSLIPEKMTKPGLYRGLFLIRQANGYSRPVTVYARLRGNKNLKKTGSGFTQYIEAEQPAGQAVFKVHDSKEASGNKCIYLNPKALRQLGDQSQSYNFTVPKDGKYLFFLRVKSEEPVGQHDSVFMALNDGKPSAIHLNSGSEWGWAGMSTQSHKHQFLEYFNLKKGSHKITLFPREPIYVDMILVTDDYKIVE